MRFFKFLTKYVMYIAMLDVVFLGSICLTFFEPKPVYVAKEHTYTVSPMPVIKDRHFPLLSAQGVYAIDLDSFVVLYDKNSSAPLFPASTTKIVTALVAMDKFSLDDVLDVGQLSIAGQKMGLVENEKITFEDLLYGLLIHSANDAAEVIAANYPGGREAFVAAMNEKAKNIFASDTWFTNPSGLDEVGQYTTVQDLVRIAQFAMANPEFANVVSTKERLARSTDGSLVHYLSNRNELLGKLDGVLGVKTGWTEGARENLVTYVERDGRKVLIAMLGSQDRFSETEELVEWIFSNYEWRDVGADYLTLQSARW